MPSPPCGRPCPLWLSPSQSLAGAVGLGTHSRAPGITSCLQGDGRRCWEGRRPSADRLGEAVAPGRGPGDAKAACGGGRAGSGRYSASGRVGLTQQRAPVAQHGDGLARGALRGPGPPLVGVPLTVTWATGERRVGRLVLAKGTEQDVCGHLSASGRSPSARGLGDMPCPCRGSWPGVSNV